jgi:hAT family C-terminal dimerisation region
MSGLKILRIISSKIRSSSIFRCLTKLQVTTLQIVKILQSNCAIKYQMRIFFFFTAKNLADFYASDLNGVELAMEIQQFKNYSEEESIERILEVIANEEVEATFGNLKTATRMFLTLMVTNCTAERSFSYLKMLKNERRSTMGDHRLSMLSAMCMNFFFWSASGGPQYVDCPPRGLIRPWWRQNSSDDAVLPANVAGDLEDEDDDCVSDEEVMDAESTDGDD